jgi:hypothetical protein
LGAVKKEFTPDPELVRVVCCILFGMAAIVACVCCFSSPAYPRVGCIILVSGALVASIGFLPPRYQVVVLEVALWPLLFLSS